MRPSLLTISLYIIGLCLPQSAQSQSAVYPKPGTVFDRKLHTIQLWIHPDSLNQMLLKEYGHVSPERLLSGPGLEAIYKALALYRQQVAEPLSAAEIARLALSGQSSLAVDTVQQFFASLGSVAGNLALTLSTFGGVYIAGGIVPKLLPLLADSEFRARFEAKGRFSAFNRQIATYVVTAEQPGLVGAAVYLNQFLASNEYGI